MDLLLSPYQALSHCLAETMCLSSASCVDSAMDIPIAGDVGVGWWVDCGVGDRGFFFSYILVVGGYISGFR